MSRTMMLAAAALAALTAGPITAAAQDEITVFGPRSETVREPGSMIETRIMTDSMVVNYSDLDLRSTAHRALLQRRVDRAARTTCNRLDDANRDGVELSGRDLCMIYAKAFAKPQVERAIWLHGS